jgi:hypothetical protein
VPDYTIEEARQAVAVSLSYAEALRWLGLRPNGGNHRLFRRYVDEIWRIPTDHFDPYRTQRLGFRRRPAPLAEVLVEGSTYHRGKLKQRLYDEGIKRRLCELCGQGETWFGRPMSLILDHINGVGDDNRLENLRIVCANCAATLDTHCGRKNRIPVGPRSCLHCDERFVPKYPAQRYCSRPCGRHCKGPHDPRPARRKVERPPFEQLLAEVDELGWSGVGRKYGVSDNAVRKWVRWYRARVDGVDAERGGGDCDEGSAGSESEQREAA